nr:MAG TPA: hypothetical protein [Bacteriophage sp.]
MFTCVYVYRNYDIGLLAYIVLFDCNLNFHLRWRFSL